ncbi:MAG: CDP-glycerol glycerophosphotransferase family protein, partial [Clostridia bacterium]|nr:CDP-glycerol glycerophosphotransferase family protein [Clostridia bacterium]
TTKYQKLVNRHIVYLSLLGRHCIGLHGPLCEHAESGTVAAYRQSRSNRMNLYVRSLNVTDRKKEGVKIFFAYCLSLLWHPSAKRRPILLYEKNSSKYEESASVVFEKLIDMGYRNAWFIIHRDSAYMDRIPDRVKDRLVYKYSFRHYLYFFACRTFIGTEALVHAIDLKTFNPFALKKTADKNLNYVFLQHGVMYMVSLDSESRKMFKPKQLNGLYRVVVSSHAEANHFTELGQHDPENLYLCGLPKFDRSTLSPDADKVVIMPTWRPWEINDARRDFTSTAYYKMMERIYNAVPEDLRDKVIILPHPLIVNELHKISASLSSKIRLDVRYDDVLRQTAVLITDYSSIAYDAFYRGSRVIFCWEEKDACMAHYGPSTKLMLNEDNVFGDVFYNTDELGEAIRRNYTGSQYEPYRERYSRLVEFHDGHNTDRLIEFLKEDGILA